MPIDNPTALVEEFKKSGEFDRLRRELLAQFQQDGSYSALKARVEEIGRQRLTTDQTLQYLTQETVQKELAQEVERYPIVERAVADVRIFSEPTFLESIQTSLQRILQEDKMKQAPASTETGGEMVPKPVAEQGSMSTEKAPESGQRTGESALSLDDTSPANVPSPTKPTEDDKMETDEKTVPSAPSEGHIKNSESTSGDATIQGNTTVDTSADMDVDSLGGK